MSTNSVFFCSFMNEGDSLMAPLRNLIVSSKPGVLKASVYRSRIGFPVLHNSGNDRVNGSLFQLVSSEVSLCILDELMGYSPQDLNQSLTLRQQVTIESNSVNENAYVYFLNPNKLNAEFKYIEGGDWQKMIHEKPPIPGKLNDKQRNYIQKLGKSSGREIVPIDLSLYRELMNLELVIDKGRRIALTKLGQEVCRYL